MLSPMESLPVELFDMISADLSIPEYKSLRLTSRQLHRFVHVNFTRLAFCEQTTTLTSPSLDRLINVSSHPSFAHAVQCLHIRVLNYHECSNSDASQRKRYAHVFDISYADTTDERAIYAYVMWSERPTKLYHALLRALRGLRQLKTVRFSMEPDPSSTSEVDEILHHRFRSECFQAVIYALTHSKIKLEKLSMGRRNGGELLYKELNLSFEAFQRAPVSLQALQQCFSKLQSLSLALKTGYGTRPLHDWAKNVCDFIGSAPKLKKLTLSLDRLKADGYPRKRSRYHWDVIQSLATSCRLAHLETLEIINCTTHGEGLSELIQGHSSSLQHIVLAHVEISQRGWYLTTHALRACQKLKYCRLVGIQDSFFESRLRERVQDEPKFIWDVEKNKRGVFDWIELVQIVHEFAFP